MTTFTERVAFYTDVAGMSRPDAERMAAQPTPDLSPWTPPESPEAALALVDRLHAESSD